MTNSYLSLSCENGEGQDNSQEASASEAPQPRSWREALCHQLKGYFQSTKDPTFLGSCYNRRKHWHVTLPLLAMTRLVFIDNFGSFGLNYRIVLIDVAFLLALIVLRHLPPASLWSDVAIMMSCAIYSCTWCLLVDSYFVGADLVFGVLLFGAGVHSFSILGYGSLMAIVRSSPLGHCAGGMLGLPAILVVAFMAFYTNVQEAKIWSERDKDYKALEKLLDLSSLGFCTIDPTNFVIQTASRGLQTALGEQDLEHKPLSDFICGMNSTLMGQLKKHAEAGTDIHPFIAPVHANSSSGAVLFDARLSFAASSPNSVNVCLNAVGEKRHGGKVDTGGSSASQRLLSPDSLFSYSVSTVSTTHQGAATAVSNSSHSELRRNPVLTDAQTQTDAGSLSGFAQRPPRLPPSTAPENPTSQLSRGSSGSRERSPGGRRRSRSRRSRSAASGDEGVGAVLPGYPATSTETCMRSILCLMKCLNLPRSATFCCPWHSSFEILVKLLETSKTETCDPLWSPNVEWQCVMCTGMNSKDNLECGLCQGPRTIAERQVRTTNIPDDNPE
mmetsp:Transcript_3742/g.6740  ORF Transcript_3742/g.6740 Transcript_3742/m.6740 type:complete len:557 (-) Transcript_3742:116-1786(-)